ncbi:MAG: hypothetical protein FK734_18570 [Asgard group archaeon]|nr:hypothetical protein [Asgard group archaeon]
MPSQDSIDTFLLENEISSDLLELSLVILRNPLTLDLSAKNLLVEDLASIDDYTKSIMSSLYNQEVFPQININTKDNRKSTEKRKLSIPDHILYHAIFIATNSSLLHTKVAISLLNYCNENLSSIDFKDFTLKESIHFNFNTDSINALNLIWSLNSRDLLDKVAFYHLPAILNLGVFTMILLLRKLASSSVKDLREASKLEGIKIQDKHSGVGYSTIEETGSSIFHIFWKNKNSNILNLAEFVAEHSPTSLSEVFNSFDNFIHQLILEDIDALALQEEIILNYDSKIIEKYLNKKKKIFIDESKLSNAIETVFNSTKS